MYTHIQHIYISNTIILMNPILLSHNTGRHQVIHVLHLLVITSRWLAAIPIGHNRWSTCGKPCYGSYTVTPSGVLKYEHSSQRPKTTKLVSQLLRRAIYLDPSVLVITSTLTSATLANPSHNSSVPRFHPPSRATT